MTVTQPAAPTLLEEHRGEEATTTTKSSSKSSTTTTSTSIQRSRGTTPTTSKKQKQSSSKSPASSCSTSTSKRRCGDKSSSSKQTRVLDQQQHASSPRTTTMGTKQNEQNQELDEEPLPRGASRDADGRVVGEAIDMKEWGPLYENFMQERDSWEKYFVVFDFLFIYVFTGGFFVYLVTQWEANALYPGAESWVHVIAARLLLALALQPFAFVIVHLYLHMVMLESWQADHTIGFPWAFFHHYVDPRMYSRTPHVYRVVIHQPTMLWALNMLIFVNCWDPMFALIWNVVVWMDVRVHEWYHTNTLAFTSWNPWSARFVGAKWFYQTLELFGFADRKKHKEEHHADRIETIHYSFDWVDFRFPVTGYLADKWADAGWALYLRFLKKLRGTYYPVRIEGLTLKDADAHRKGLLYAYMMPMHCLLMWSAKLAILYLIPISCGGVPANLEDYHFDLFKDGYEVDVDWLASFLGFRFAGSPWCKSAPYFTGVLLFQPFYMPFFRLFVVFWKTVLRLGPVTLKLDTDAGIFLKERHMKKEL